MAKKVLTTRDIRKRKRHSGAPVLSMLTCYDYQNAQLLDQTNLDLILVGDSLGNVMLGYETTVEVSLEEMIVFGAAVKRGAKNKFVILDLPFGSYANVDKGLENGIKLFQKTKAQAIKLEGAFPQNLELITKLTQTGIPTMGHIGLVPQSVHQLGGYYTHGKNEMGADRLLREAKALEEAGCFAVVLECVTPTLSAQITQNLNIPTIGIGSGVETDGQVLVLNDLFQNGPLPPPKFAQPIANLFEYKKELLEGHLQRWDDLSMDQDAGPSAHH
jgi:3-methyl-2-oxobutanoate hydroxymethyltransferase